MSDRIYKILNKIYPALYYVILFGLFFKGEIFRIHTDFFSLTFTSAKNFIFIFIVVWALLKIRFKPKVSIPFIILMVFSLISLILSQYCNSSIKAVLVFFVYVLWFYSLKDILQEEKHTVNTVKIFILIACVVNILDIYFHYSVGFKEIVERYPFWQGKNALGLFLVMALCFSGSILVSGRWKWLIYINSVLLVFGVILSYSRSAWIACFAAIVGILAYRLKHGLLILVCLIIMLFTTSPKMISQRVSSTFSGQDTNIKQRIELWDNTLEIIKARPLIGTGLGTFREAYMKMYPDSAPKEGEGSRTVRHAHNLYLQILSETGIIGLFFVMYLIIAGVMIGIKNIFKEKKPLIVSIRYGALLGIITFLIYSITDCTISWQFTGDSFSHINLIWIILWVLILRPAEGNIHDET
jgi:O-antigen ligase